MPNADLTAELQETVRAAFAGHRPLAIRGAGSKRFYTGELAGEPLVVAAHRGIVSHEPTELVITARAGTPLAEIEAALAERNQMPIKLQAVLRRAFQVVCIRRQRPPRP